ncbi:MAG: aromatic amino acid transport family protein [Candidatus Magasanikbacteria bacterium]|jgi:amino acid permease
MFEKENPVILQGGVFKKPIGINSAVFMITGMTIGAGILGIPYVVAQVGIWIGLAYILVLGIVMLCLNLMIGEITVRTKNSFQLPGLVGKYLGGPAKIVMSIIIILSGLGTLLAYLVGEGESLSGIFGGDPAWWTVIFWTIGSILIWRGLQTVKTAEKILSILVIGIILGLSLAFLPHVQVVNFSYLNWSKFFLPYGVILFALHASPSIAEAHALLPGSQRHFRKALVIGTLIPVFVYIIFALAVVGVMGKETTEIATLGLGNKFGPWVRIFANVFAVFAMGTGFMGLGVALKQSLVWDWKIPSLLATILVILTPLTFFMAGWRDFVSILGVVGGLFLGIEAILMALVYWKAKKSGDLPADRYSLPLAGLLTALVFVVFTIATVVSIIGIVNF